MADGIGDKKSKQQSEELMGKEAREVNVRLVDVSKRFGKIVAVDSLSLDIENGEFLILLGPSGSGKTTTLRMIGGFEVPSGGEIYIRGKIVTNVPPNRRETRMVFQDLALFPHMSVGKNVEYGLQFTERDKKKRRLLAGNSLASVSLDGFYNRNVNTLSGGERQRVALARALVTQPPILLLDEPLGALDEKLREQTQVELKMMHRELGITFLMVTHNQEEALSMSTRVAVVNEGRLEQVASPEVLYENPETVFVAGFVGTAKLFKGEIIEDSAEKSKLFSNRIEFFVPSGFRKGEETTLVVRPERIKLGAEAEGKENMFEAKIQDILYKGPALEYGLILNNGEKIRARVDSKSITETSSIGDTISIGWDIKDCKLVRS